MARVWVYRSRCGG